MILEAGARPLPRLWPSVWKLLRLRFIIFINSFRRASLKGKAGTLILGLLFLGFLVFLFWLSLLALRLLRSPALSQVIGDVQPFLQSVPVLVLGGAFIGILLTSFGVLLQALYLSGDMDFLLSAPVPIRAVFITKLLQAILPNFGLITLFSLPVLFGLGAARGFAWLYFPLVLIMLFALSLAAAGLSSLLVMAIVRAFPARRVAEVLGFVGATISFLCSQIGNLAQFEGFSEAQASATIYWVARLDAPWSPLAWAGRGLVGIGEERWLAGAGFSILALGMAAVLFTTALVTAERLYYSGWASMQGAARKKKNGGRAVRRPARSWTRVAERYVPGAVRAIMVKDYYVLRRDLRNLSQLITPIIFGLVYALMFLRGGDDPFAGRGEAPPLVAEMLRNLAIYGNVGISLFVSWMLLARLASMGFTQEGRSYWVIKTAPISTFQLLVSKFLVAYLPALLLSCTFLLGISLLQGLEPAGLLFTLPAVALIVAGNAGINLAFGVLGANMDWEDPRHMLKGTSNCFSTIVVLAYLPFSLLLFFAPPLLFMLLGGPERAGQALGLLLGGLFGLACAVLPPWLVSSRVARLGEKG